MQMIISMIIGLIVTVGMMYGWYWMNEELVKIQSEVNTAGGNK